MKKIHAAVLLLLVALASGAHAETYNFSYEFGDGPAVIGSLSGHLNGDLVENVSNVHIQFNGTDFSGALTGARWDSATQDWNSAAGAVVSTIAGKNNFIFADANPQTRAADVSNYFYFVNSSDMGQQAFALNCNVGNCADVAFDQPANASWTLVAAPVPEPASAALLAAGLGLVGVARRRRAA